MIVWIAESGLLARAGRAAVRAQKEAGLPVTYKCGNLIVREKADGRRKVIGKIATPTYWRPKGVRRICER
jgi:hypothetical protein